ncbi:MAG TPA: diacylglycerol kinase family protein [Longimicrobiaceae bacterium]|nr:diacylglycerol kinase family protein [Longimicrobiaceae bacterium]
MLVSTGSMPMGVMGVVPVFCNREAGGGAQAEAQLAAAFTDSALAFELCAASPAELAERIGEAVQAGVPAVGVAGGDGTISTAAGVLAGTGTALAVFPGGTLNHFAVALGIRSYEDAIAALRGGRTIPVDVGEVNGRVFVNGASIGIYPQKLRIRGVWERWIGKWPAAAVAGTAAMLDFHRHVLEIESAALRRVTVSPLVYVGPGRGSFQRPHLGPRELCSGMLEMVIVSAASRLRLLGLALHALRRGGDGLGICSRETDCTVHHGEHFLVSSWFHRRIDLGIDGELVRLEAPLDFRIRRGALRVFVGDRQDLGGSPPRHM